MARFTITQLSSLMQNAYAWDRPAYDQAHRTIRNLVAKELVKTESLDRRGSAGIDVQEVFKVRLLQALSVAGFESSELHTLLHTSIDPPADYMDEYRDEKGDRRSRPMWKDDSRRAQIRQIAEKIREGENWDFRVTLCRDTGGNRVVSGDFFPDSTAPSAKDKAVTDRFRNFQELTVEAEIRIPLNDLFRPLLKELSKVKIFDAGC